MCSKSIQCPVGYRLQLAYARQSQRNAPIDGEESEAVPGDSGVPHGTVLRPLLFLCHINDFPDAVKSTVRLFADDCLLYRQIKSSEDHISIQQDLQNLETCGKTWGMRFNAKKCYIMSINSNPRISTSWMATSYYRFQKIPT